MEEEKQEAIKLLQGMKFYRPQPGIATIRAIDVTENKLTIERAAKAIGIERNQVDIRSNNPHVDEMGNTRSGGGGIINNIVTISTPQALEILANNGIDFPGASDFIQQISR